jgi:hypothetical protein
MRHFIGLILAIAMAAALFFGGGWGVTHMSSLAQHTSGLPNRTALIALAVLLGTGLLLGLLLAVPAVSPLAAGLPGLVLLAWTALLVVNYHRAITWVPMQSFAYGAGFRALLTSGVLAVAGLAMVIPLCVPSRWYRMLRDEDDDESMMPTVTGLLS